MAIRILDRAIINRIAAGEIIERPVSVVKELVENSIDADATEITIELVDGGKKSIVVTDNGHGMDENDAALCTKRHATSKIKDMEELFSVRTLGFRGEALASIAAVSNMELRTKTSDADVGTLVRVEADKIVKMEKVACNKGTRVEVQDLFFNMPVRMNALRNATVEHSLITDITIRYALANPRIFFRLVSNKQAMLTSPSCNSFFDKIVSVYGSDMARELLDISYSDGIAIKGYISRPAFTVKDRSMQSFFVNGRYVRNKTIADAIYSAYHTLLLTGRHPVAIVMVSIDCSKVDANIHPAKSEVKVVDEVYLYNAVYDAVSFAINKLKPDPKITEIKGAQQTLKLEEKQDIVAEERKGPDIKIIGQLGRAYIIAEDKEGLLLIDQHACQERINYEKFMAEYENGNVAKQGLLEPQVLNLSVTETAVVKENLRLLSKLGFELEPYGTNAYLLRAVPSVFRKLQNETLLKDMIAELGVDKKELEKVKEGRLILFACRNSVKAGDVLGLAEMSKLLNQLYSAKQPFTCPHGRPVVVDISFNELEKRFKRRV